MKKGVLCRLIAAVLIMAMMLTACSKSGTSTTSSASDNSSSSTTSSSSSSSSNNSSSSSKEEQIKLTFLYSADESDETSIAAAWMKDIIKKFEEDNPNIKIEPTVIADGDDYLTKVTTELAAGKVPDVFRTWLTGRLEPFVKAGHVMPLNDIVENNEALKKVVSDTAKTYSQYGDEKFYAIPLIQSSEIVFYNKEIFEQYGLKVPNTIDEFNKICETLLNNGITPIAMGGGDAWVSAIPYMTIFQRMDKDNAMYNKVVVENQPLFNDQLFIDVANAYLDMSKYFNKNSYSINYEEGKTLFTTGKAAMIFDGTWSCSSYANIMGDKVGVFNYPDVDGASTEFLMNFDEGYSIGSKTKYPEAAGKFLAAIFSEEAQATYAEAGNLIAAVNIKYDTSKVPSVTNEVATLLATAKSTNIPWDNPLGTNVGTEFNMTVQSLLGGSDPAKAFENLNSLAANEWE